MWQDKEIECNKYDVVVIPARFQVHKLHAGHIHIIKQAYNYAPIVCIALGVTKVLNYKNPLTVEQRKRMILYEFPTSFFEYFELPCFPSDIRWSQELDLEIDKIYPGKKVCLMGSRKSFASRYHGKYEIIESDTKIKDSGSEIRKQIVKSGYRQHSEEFLKGIIYANENRLPVVYNTVDIAVFRRNPLQILVANKKTEYGDKYVLPGGFIDVTDQSKESAARRELLEETGIIIRDDRDLEYRGSVKINDYRYEGCEEKEVIMTSLFKYFLPDDLTLSLKDNNELQGFTWLAFHPMYFGGVAEIHRPLFNMLWEDRLRC